MAPKLALLLVGSRVDTGTEVVVAGSSRQPTTVEPVLIDVTVEGVVVAVDEGIASVLGEIARRVRGLR